MQKRSGLYFAFVSLVVAGAFAAGGCSGKKVASSSGDASSTSKEKVETVNPERMVTVPDDRRATTEAARSPFDSPPSGGGTGGSPSPGGGAAGGAGAASMAPAGGAAGEGGLGDIFFDFDQYTVRRDAQPVLEANAALIRKMAGKTVVIEGHCDERGTQAYNLVLGEKRARSTKRYLEDLGVPAAKLKITSFGEIRPFCKERTEQCYQQNRRAHFTVQ